MKVKVCIGSACHLKGSGRLADKLQELIAKNGIGDRVELSGAFCLGKCNREGVTIQIDDEVHTGVNDGNFDKFFSEEILGKL